MHARVRERHPVCADSHASSCPCHACRPPRCGDLNYRIDLGMPSRPAEPRRHTPSEAVNTASEVARLAAVERISADAQRVRELIGAREWPALAAHDQLRAAQACGHALVDFSEAELRFEPTFKVQRTLQRPGEPPEYAAPRDPKKVRVPSWCDRILHRSLPHLRGEHAAAATSGDEPSGRPSSRPADRLTKRENAAAAERRPALEHTGTWPAVGVSTSDHKPVYARFILRPPACPKEGRVALLTLAVSGLALRGEIASPACGAPLLPRAHRVKLRFFTRPAGLLVAHADGTRRTTSWSAARGATGSGGNANVRTKVRTLSGAEEMVEFDDTDVPQLHLRCRAEELDRVTLIVTVNTYVTANTRPGGAELRGTAQVQLSPPDERGHVAIGGSLRLQHCSSELPISLEMKLSCSNAKLERGPRNLLFLPFMNARGASFTNVADLGVSHRPAQIARGESVPPDFGSRRNLASLVNRSSTPDSVREEPAADHAQDDGQKVGEQAEIPEVMLPNKATSVS